MCKRIISNFLCLTILFSTLVAPSYAINDYGTLSSDGETSYCIEFDHGTSFSDNPNEVSFCVGVNDTSDLVANKWYYWYIDGLKGSTANNYRHDGRFRVAAQRGYRLVGIGSGAFSVFAEEHEGICRLGVPDGNNWVPEGTTAWTLAASNKTWHFKSSTDPVTKAR